MSVLKILMRVSYFCGKIIEKAKSYMASIIEGELSHFNGNQISFSDNSSTEIDLKLNVYASEHIYTATFDATTTPKDPYK